MCEKEETIERLIRDIEDIRLYNGVGYYDECGNFVAEKVDDWYFRKDIYTYRLAVKVETEED